MATGHITRDELSDAFRAGRRVGFGISALVLSLVSFLTLLGAEKAILAIILGVVAIRGSGQAALARRLGIIAICLGALFLLTLVVVLVVYQDQLRQFIETLQKLS